MRTPVAAFAALSALFLAACGTESVSVPAGDSSAAGAEIFATNCAGCHTLGSAGSNGSGNRALRAQGPNFDERSLGSDEVLFAIRNGGYSGAIMPQNIVVGEQASLVAEFVSKYSGTESVDSIRPSPAPGTESSEEPEGTSAGETDATAPDEGPAPQAEAGGASGGGAQGRSGQGGAGSGGSTGGGSGSGSTGGSGSASGSAGSGPGSAGPGGGSGSTGGGGSGSGPTGSGNG